MCIHIITNSSAALVRNALKVVIVTAAIGAVAAIGAFLFDALWLFGW